LWVALAGLPACADTLEQPGPAPVHHDFTLSDPSPPLLLRIESCRVDADACPDLCNALLRLNNLAGPATTCNVTFDSSATYVGVDSSGFGPVVGGG
jgi:hypothetical protein